MKDNNLDISSQSGILHAARDNALESKAFQRRLTYAENDRTAGRIAVWQNVPRAQEANLAMQAVQDRLSGVEGDDASSDFARALAAEGAVADDQIDMVSASDNAQDGEVAEDSFGFLDLLDMVNPLQHIPVVGSIYRSVTGDTIKPISQMVGGMAFTGPLGAVFPLVGAVIDQEFGDSAPQDSQATAFDQKEQGDQQGLWGGADDDALALVSFADLGAAPDVPDERAPQKYAHETRHYNE
ncbi:MAG: hypothetical protein CL570_07970 [Alphaproteobacteria bacterium]|nr:hypothetical protein [Alphaproteobacteria bacterium]